MVDTIPANVIGDLRGMLAEFRKSKTYEEVVEPKNRVLSEFQPVFSPERVQEITEAEFKSFLLFEKNRHWSGLHRQGGRMCADMGKLRKALSILVDETKPVAERLTTATEMVSGLGKNTATGILLVTQSEKYGVWNNRSEAHMRELGIWPDFDRGALFGECYVRVNDVLLKLRDALQIDLWALDALWWFLDAEEESSVDALSEEEFPVIQEGTAHRFGLERHLHVFMRDNWDQLELGKDWKLFGKPEDDEPGYEYPCDVGRIDLLARHRSESRWLVVELKRNQTNDQTIGQVLRYMGWVKEKLAKEGDCVEGMIICREDDKTLHYALKVTQGVHLRLYEVEFHLRPADSGDDQQVQRKREPAR